jgi:putative ABC transport system permease protein
MLAAIGGLILGAGLAWLLTVTVSALPVTVSFEFLLLAEIIVVLIGLISGLLPTAHAASLQPVEALREK